MSKGPPDDAEVNPHQVTQWLRQAANGDAQAEIQLLEALYRDLHQIATRQLRQERKDHTLQPTALVHEAYVRLLRGGRVAWNDRIHFLAVASKAMRRILVDHARRRTTAKRGSGVVTVELTDVAMPTPHSPERVLAVDRALSKLALVEPRQARIVELKFFAGLIDDEVAALLEVSPRTIKREWAAAKAFLYGELH
jgi:RNA polymerase sigma factor (TIGR02999 family)